MKYFRLMSIFVMLAMVLSLVYNPMPASATPVETGVPDLSKVDPNLLETFKTESTAEFYIILAQQADLSPAAALQTKLEKGAFVFNALRQTAADTQTGIIAMLEKQGIEYRSWYIANMVSATGTLALVETLTARADVAAIEPAPDPHPDPVTKTMTVEEKINAIEWNVTRVGAPDAWAMGFDGDGMVVGDNDTGVQWDHPALINKYRGWNGSAADHNYNWWDASGDSDTPVDYNGHGTHTMGTMIGDDGGENQIGVAPGAQWIACAGMNVECLQFFLAPWDLDGMNPDPSKAPDAVNNSWYDESGFDYRPTILALNAAGVAVIKSAGNWGSGCNTISPPGNVPEIIATAAFGVGDVIASFSSRGPNSDYGETILKPEVAAPGVNVRSSVPGGLYEGGWNGTSMAAPHSTGMVAVLWSAAPCIRGDVPLTKEIMMMTAEPKVDGQCGPFVDHPNDVWGWGILDFEAAVTYAVGYCGGMGAIDGTVTSDGDPLAGVNVLAESLGGFVRSDVTDDLGFYSMQTVSDTYTVTASAYGYETVVIEDVQVTADITTTVDIDMPALPTYILSGYVREAATNNPLAATVSFLDAPVAPVSTDPVTGFYSVEVAAGTWTIQAVAADHAPLMAVVEVLADTQQDFTLWPICQVFFDDVEDGNTGWEAETPWAITEEDSHSPTHSWTDSPGGTYGNYADTSLISPVWDLTDYTGLGLNFFHRYALETNYDYAYLEFSLNGGTTWTAAKSYNGTAGWNEQTIDLSILDGVPEARIRFHLETDVSVTYDGWHVDDIALIGGGPGCIPDFAPIADFESPDPAYVGVPAMFHNLSAGMPEPNYVWDFGDGSEPSMDFEPVHTYTETGTYTVTLTASNYLGEDVATGTVEVVEIPYILVEPEAITITLPLTSTGSAGLSISNVGLGDLQVTGITASAPWLTVPVTTPLTLLPGEELALSVDFDTTGLMTGTYTASISIFSNDPDFAVFVVDVTLIVVDEMPMFYINLPVVITAP